MKKVLLILVLIIAALIVYFSLSSGVTDNLDTYIYDLPFKEGAGFKVVQGYGGRFSHRNKAALDFDMPAGTPIYAARGGSIYSTKDDSNEGGLFTNEKKANYIIIKHDDGSFGCYWHLKRNGVVVKTGHVSQGEQIGFSGATGQVFRPHLHFSVKRKLNYQMNSFVKTKFKTSKGVIFLEKDETYERPKD